MTVAFEAKCVNCFDAIGGEILQVSFDTIRETQGDEERSTPYILISRNFEFSGSATIEWHDGHDYDGGARIVCLTLTRDRVSIKVDRGLDFDVAFRVPDRQFAKLTSYLKSMIDARVCFAE